MLYVLLGSLSFAPLYLFDRLKIVGAGKVAAPLFPLGCLGIFASTVGAFFSGQPRFAPSVGAAVVCGILAGVFFLMMLWALFFALPFSSTYVEGVKGAVVDTGLYALCRHPGVLFFGAMYLTLWPISGRDTMLLCALCLTACDVLHVWVQDRYYFSKTITGYDAYRQRVPFLIPSTASVRRCIQTLRNKEVRKP